MFSAEDADLMVGIATNSAIACFNAAEDKDIPVIFTASLLFSTDFSNLFPILYPTNLSPFEHLDYTRY